MTNETLAEYSLLSTYAAMAVLTLAMLTYVLYLARAATAREDGERRRTPIADPVAVGAGPGAPADAPLGDEADTDADAAIRVARIAGFARSLTWLATLLIGVAVVTRGASVGRTPLGNLYEFVLAASLVVLFTFSAWTLRRNVDWLGVFITTPVLLMLGVAVTVWYTEAAQLLPSLQSYWLVIHVTVATIAVGVFTVGAMIALMSLLVDHAERTESSGWLARLRRVLPGSRELERLSYGLHIIAFPLWTFTLIAGAIWARQAWASYWNWDPKEVWSFIIWVVYAAYLHARATTGISRQRATYIALAGFGCIILNYSIVNMFFVGQHSYSGL